MNNKTKGMELLKQMKDGAIQGVVEVTNCLLIEDVVDAAEKVEENGAVHHNTKSFVKGAAMGILILGVASIIINVVESVRD